MPAASISPTAPPTSSAPPAPAADSPTGADASLTFDTAVFTDGRPARRLVSRLLVPRPLDQVFPFFADAANLEVLTPPWLRFRILTPLPIAMRVGALIDYRIILKVVPMRWRSEISVWDPPRRFVDQQVRGPYRLWHHEHAFREVGGGTEVIDTVHYRHLGGAPAHAMLVRPDLERIFRYRHHTLADLMARMGPPA